MTRKVNDPLFDATMPRWWRWTANVWRALSLTALLAYIFYFASDHDAVELGQRVIVVCAC